MMGRADIEGSKCNVSIDRSAIIRKDYVILRTAIKEKFDASCEKNSDEFFKIF